MYCSAGLVMYSVHTMYYDWTLEWCTQNPLLKVQVQNFRGHEGGKYLCLFVGRRKFRQLVIHLTSQFLNSVWALASAPTIPWQCKWWFCISQILVICVSSTRCCDSSAHNSVWLDTVVSQDDLEFLVTSICESHNGRSVNKTPHHVITWFAGN